MQKQETCMLIGELAILIKQKGYKIGQNRLFYWLRENGYLIKQGKRRNLPTQKSMELKLFEIKQRVIQKPDKTMKIVLTTMVTKKGQEYFINKYKNISN